jgi:hypothetical protein
MFYCWLIVTAAWVLTPLLLLLMLLLILMLMLLTMMTLTLMPLTLTQSVPCLSHVTAVPADDTRLDIVCS